MDAVVQLTEEHARFESLIASIRAVGSGPSTRKVHQVEALTSAFEEHAGAEEAVCYPACGQIVPAAIIEKLIAEHHLIDLLVLDIATVPVGSRSGDAKLTVLLETIERHLRHEQALLFTPAAEQLSNRERREIAVATAAFRHGDPHPLRLLEAPSRRAGQPGARRTLSGRLLGQLSRSRNARRGHGGPSKLAAGTAVEPSRQPDEHGLIEYKTDEVKFADGRPSAVGTQELYSPTTYQQTDTGFWALYPAGNEVVAVHPWGALQGPPAVVADALTDVAQVAKRDADRAAVKALQAFLAPAAAAVGRPAAGAPAVGAADSVAPDDAAPDAAAETDTAAAGAAAETDAAAT